MTRNKMKNLLTGGNERTSLLKKNILGSILIKGADVLVGLLLVPVTLGYLNQYEYGIWMTLYSLLSWINSFDIGLSNGLRNKLAESIAVGDKTRAREYVSTTAIMLLIIAVVLVVLLTGSIRLFDWYQILNVDESSVGNLSQIIYLSFCLFCFNFTFKFIGSIYQGMQLPVVNAGILLAGHVISLLVIWSISYFLSGNLMVVALIYSSSYPLIYIIFYPVTFKRVFPYLSPSLKYFRKGYIKELLSISVLFFAIQVAGIVLFSMTNIIISHDYGPEMVTPYNIAYKYYQAPVIIFNLLLVPIWSAVTDAYTRGDTTWIIRVNNKLKIILLGIALLLIIMTGVSQIIFIYWVGPNVKIPMNLCLLMAIYIFLILYSTSYSFLLNGMNKVGLQAINTIFVAILFYPLCKICGKMIGMEGILVAMIISNLSGSILNAIQFKKVVNNKASGLWAR